MPTVLLVSPYLPPHIGGVERYVESVARQLVRKGWRVVIATPSSAASGQEILDQLPVTVRHLDASGRISNTPIGLHWVRDLRRIIAEEQIDVVNAHAPVPGLADAAERAAGSTPFVLTYHAGPMRKARSSVNLALWGYERFVVSRTIRRSTALICSSDYVEGFLTTLGHSTPTTVIPPSVDVEQFAFSGIEGRRGLLFVGSLERATRYKALDTLLEAVATLARRDRTITLDVAGDGNARGEYEAACDRLGIADRVRFRGEQAPSELARRYQTAAALVLPSRFDSFPTVILEAMACGTPVIASRVGGIPSVVLDGHNGLLIEPGTEAGIVDSVERLAADPALAARLGVEGRRTIEETLTARLQGERTAEVLEDAVAAARRPRAQATDHRALRPQTTRRRRLLMVTPYFPPHVGGVEQYAYNLSLALVETGEWEVTVVTTRISGLRTTVDTDRALRVIRLGIWGRYSYTPFSPLWPWQLRREIRRFDPDVVNAHTPVPILSDAAAWATRGRPFLLTYHAATLDKEASRLFHLLERTYGRIERQTIGRTDAVLAVSDFVADALRSRVTGALVTFPNAVPAASLTEGPARPVRGDFAFLARLDKEHRWKGLELVIRALELCPGARLKVAGEGDMRAHYEQVARECGVGDRVVFLGTVTGADKDGLLRTASAVIAYPTTSNDAFPTVLLEAWAARTPVVAADIGALSTLVHDGIDGWLVRPSDPVALARAMTAVIEDPTGGAERGNAGRAAIEHATWERQAVRFGELVDSLDPRHRSPSPTVTRNPGETRREPATAAPNRSGGTT